MHLAFRGTDLERENSGSVNSGEYLCELSVIRHNEPSVAPDQWLFASQSMTLHDEPCEVSFAIASIAIDHETQSS
jgi:hypothetical protein